MPRKRGRGRVPVLTPRVEENAGRTPPPAAAEDGCRSCEPSPRRRTGGPPRSGRVRIDHSHAGFPQGFMTRRIRGDAGTRPAPPALSSSRCVWLTNAIDRIVKDPNAGWEIYA